MAVFVAVLTGWVAFAVYAQAQRGHDLEATARQLSAQNAAIALHIAQVKQEIANSSDPGWLEEQARKIGYVLPNEVVYVLVSPGAGALPPGGGVDAQPPVWTPPPTPSPSPTATPKPGASPTPYLFTLASPTPH